jgi:hypothetical protein
MPIRMPKPAGGPGSGKASCRTCQGHAYRIACPLRASCCPACSVRKLHDGTILMIIDLAIIGIALLLGEPLASPRTLRAHQLTIWTSRRAMLGK